jgi:AP-4 complex subunit mu-1
MNKTLRISPPDGEFTVMNYRINGDFAAPFRIFPVIEEISSSKVEVIVKIKACFDKDTYATHARIKIPVP